MDISTAMTYPDNPENPDLNFQREHSIVTQRSQADGIKGGFLITFQNKIDKNNNIVYIMIIDIWQKV